MLPGRLALGHGSALPKIQLLGAWLGYKEMKGLKGTEEMATLVADD